MNDVQDQARQVVARYHASGLSGLSDAEVRLLLSEKLLHLSQVSERCAQGIEMQLNIPLKRGLEAEIREIGSSMSLEARLDSVPKDAGKPKERDVERGMER